MKSVNIPSPSLVTMAVGVALMIAIAGIACVGVGDDTQSESGGEGNAVVVADQRESDPGISDDQILFGQSAVFSGPSQELGRGMRLGIRAAFYEINQAGGINGRELQLKTLDDSYETDYAFHTTKWLIEKEQVFALVGAVGTPTSRVATPLAHDAGVPFVAPFTGAEFLRDPALDNVLNLRASYYQETEELVARLTEDLGVTRVGVLYQDDSFGTNGLEGVRLALERRGLKPIGSWHYQRNSGAVRHVASEIVEANPGALIMIAAHEPVATTVELLRSDIDPVFMTVSFGGGDALAKALGRHGDGVYVTQVVPFPEDTRIPVVGAYQDALARYDPKAKPGFVSLEGYLAGRLAITGLQACGRELSRRCFIDALHNSGDIDIDGFELTYGPNDNQGSDSVFLTVVGADGKYHQVTKIGGEH